MDCSDFKMEVHSQEQEFLILDLAPCFWDLKLSCNDESVILPFCLLKNTIRRMKYELSTTKIFDEWFQKLDRTTRNKLLARFDRIGNGNFGDHKTIENNLLKLRCFFDGGIRIYYTIRDHCVVLLLSGGDKSSQTKDIEKVRIILEMLGD